MRYNTSDNDKKPRDNQANMKRKTLYAKRTEKLGEHQYSKKTDHI